MVQVNGYDHHRAQQRAEAALEALEVLVTISADFEEWRRKMRRLAATWSELGRMFDSKPTGVKPYGGRWSRRQMVGRRYG